MKYAVYLPNFGPFGDARCLAELSQIAEDVGWDGFFIWDHVARDWPVPMVDPWVALTAIALNTRYIQMGALVTPLARRRPWKVARETVSLDHLSEGRLIFGAGLGRRSVEWDDLGEERDLVARAKMLDEGLEVLEKCWSGTPFDHNGTAFHVSTTGFLPRPLQQPRIPIWVAGYWPHKPPFRRAARFDGAFALFDVRGEEEIHQVNEMVSFTQSQLKPGKPFDFVYAGTVTPANDRSRAAAIVAPYAAAGITWWLEKIDPAAWGLDIKSEWPFEALVARIKAGPPKT